MSRPDGLTPTLLIPVESDVILLDGPGNSWPLCHVDGCWFPMYAVPLAIDKHRDLDLAGLCKNHRDLAIYRAESRMREEIRGRE